MKKSAPNLINRRNMDTRVRPGDDFYQYANGKWLRRTNIPKSESTWGSFWILRDQNRRTLRGILEGLCKERGLSKGSAKRRMRDLYKSALDIRTRNKLGLSPILELLNQIDALEHKGELTHLLARLHMRGIDAFWSPYIDQDDKNSEKMILRLHQGGLGMPDRDYYTKSDRDSLRVRKGYVKHLKRVFALSKICASNEYSHKARVLLSIETKMAHSAMTRVELRDVAKCYNKKSISDLQRLAREIDWNEYFNSLGVLRSKSIIVDQIKFLKKVNMVITTTALEELKFYLKVKTIATYAPLLTSKFAAEHFNFHGRIIAGLKAQPENWKRGVGAVESYLRDDLGKLYVKKYFPRKSERRMKLMVDDIFFVYRERIKELDWMGRETKKKALAKLGKMNRKIGHPRKWMTYRGLQISHDEYAKNCMVGQLHEFKRQIAKLAKKTDRSEWYMSAPTVNAYYSPNHNDICFPAGILQPPFFYHDADDAVNYGAIGAVIGHEITHGFDDKGSEFDGNGNLKNWWTRIDRKRFDAKAKKLIRQYDSFRVIEGMHVNGKLTIGENIADLGGLVIAYCALARRLGGKKADLIGGFTPQQRFFLSGAIAERQLVRAEQQKMQIRNDPHSPGEFRINGPLSNMQQFYDAFNVSFKDKMYRTPRTRVVIW